MKIKNKMTVKRGSHIYTYKRRDFVLGETYYLQWYNYLPMKCKFIQVTRCGYNFLNEETNKCILKHHLYVPKKIQNYIDNNTKILYIFEDLYVLPPIIAESIIAYKKDNSIENV